MLERNNRLDVQGIEQYVAFIVKAFVEDQDKVVVTHVEEPSRFIFTIAVSERDLPALETQQITFRSLNHLIKKVADANLDGKSGALNNEFGMVGDE